MASGSLYWLLERLGYSLTRRDELEAERAAAAAVAQQLMEAGEAIEALKTRRAGLNAKLADRDARLTAVTIHAQAVSERRDQIKAQHRKLKADYGAVFRAHKTYKGKLDGALARQAALEQELRAAQAEVVSTRAEMFRKLVHARARPGSGASPAMGRADGAAIAERDAAIRNAEALRREVTRLQAAVGAARPMGGVASPTAPAGSPQVAFELAQALQEQGDLAGAVAAYLSAGPGLPDLLAQMDPTGRPFAGPDFLIIGPPRAGTTWLKKQLGWHPEVFMLAREHHYFSATPHFGAAAYVAKFVSRSARYIGTHKDWSVRPSSPAARVFGEKSPTYLPIPETNVALCAALFPRARLVCIAREPVARAWSHLKHVGVDDYAADLDHLRQLPAWNTLDEVVRHGRYREHLSRWARYFPPEQIMVVDFHRIAAEPDAVYREVLAHIGADPSLGRLHLAIGEGATGQAPMPPVLRDHLEAAYDGEPFDAASLTADIVSAAKGAS